MSEPVEFAVQFAPGARLAAPAVHTMPGCAGMFDFERGQSRLCLFRPLDVAEAREMAATLSAYADQIERR